MHIGDGALAQISVGLPVELHLVAWACSWLMMSGAEPVPDEDTMCATLTSAAAMRLLYIPLDR